ncbi:Glycosyl hydrolases family 2 [Catalinimonas alkaloidigena]|uniref:Glycosyl hydrolases family 2 n=1 Tax=Catalinimonas alkaloidigena TaxID=1075417 RepID=A0A1G8Y6M4_9BACT|nr:sugar-binding domain-containing protein [Catalinimonas alkaloidigena]SDJ98466.1 Glycosyl hydrolases family 2 [Catalinimonas alkaloidigena]
MNVRFPLVALFFCLLLQVRAQSADPRRIDLAGTWAFRIDSLDEGVAQQWFRHTLDDRITLPGSMTTNGKGNPISVATPWMASLMDSAWFFAPEYAPYRQPGQVKIPFWLQPDTYYQGAAWYQRAVDIPPDWQGTFVELMFERSHWETTLWVDSIQVGMRNSLGTPHRFDLSGYLTPGPHRLTVRIDNRVKDFDVGPNSHSISDHTQGNWNGLVGELALVSRPSLHLDALHVFPDVAHNQIVVRTRVLNPARQKGSVTLELSATAEAGASVPPLQQDVTLAGDTTDVELVYPMGDAPLLWDEFQPNLYTLRAQLRHRNKSLEERSTPFGMREFAREGTQFTINGKPTFLRGTLECAIFPETGYPPTDEAAWRRIFEICRSYGLNHLRFHSWTPPEAAFAAADRLGFYLQVECSSWANQGATIGDGGGLDRYIWEESARVVNEYGNHPSFCLMAYGNEPSGPQHVAYLTDFVQRWQAKDHRRLYTTGAGWPVVAESDFNSTSDPRIQHWGEGLKSIINSQPPRSDYDWADVIKDWKQPTVSHEIGQWCVYPDFKEIARYDGPLKAKNFEIFQATLADHGMAALADSFLLASGKLQTLCYKADIEAALRTPGFGGFQLLDLHDFPGQGTALVGVLNPFWEEKGYVTAAEYSAFCNATVPLVRLPKMIYQNSETLEVPVQIAHFGAAPLTNVTPTWELRDASGQVRFQGSLPTTTVPLGNAFSLGTIQQSLATVDQPGAWTLAVTVGGHRNTWDLFVYPAERPEVGKKVLVTQQLDAAAQKKLRKGGRVLLTLAPGALRPEAGGDIPIGFSSIFWNTAWTNGQPPHSLGLLCDPAHPAFAAFPTAYHSNWQWWDAMRHGQAIRLDSLPGDVRPLLRVIDDWVTARPLGLLFECNVGKGKLLVSGIDLLTDQAQRPEAQQLLYSLRRYMEGEGFRPAATLQPEAIQHLLKE